MIVILRCVCNCSVVVLLLTIAYQAPKSVSELVQLSSVLFQKHVAMIIELETPSLRNRKGNRNSSEMKWDMRRQIQMY